MKNDSVFCLVAAEVITYNGMVPVLPDFHGRIDKIIMERTQSEIELRNLELS